MPRENGPVLTFDVVELTRVVDEVLRLSDVQFIGFAGHLPADGLLGKAGPRAIGRPDIDRPEARGHRALAFAVNATSTGRLARVLTARTRWRAYHWWAYSEHQMLISCYDWDGGPNFAHPSLDSWLQRLADTDVVRILEPSEFTDEFFERLNALDQDEPL